MARKHLSIIFCGGCNPRISRKNIAEAVASQLGKHGHEVSYNQLDADFIVYLSGCSVSCAEQRKVDSTPCLVVAGSSIDSTSYNESVLAEEIITRGRSYFEKL